MPYPNDRRKSVREGDEVLSHEYLAMLVVCGGEVRVGDRATLPWAADETRRGRRAGGPVEGSSQLVPNSPSR